MGLELNRTVELPGIPIAELNTGQIAEVVIWEGTPSRIGDLVMMCNGCLLDLSKPACWATGGHLELGKDIRARPLIDGETIVVRENRGI